MPDKPLDLVPLALVWQCLEPAPRDWLIDAIGREFQARQLVVYGTVSPFAIDPVPLPPTWGEINWIGPPGTTDYRPCGERILDPTQPALFLREPERRLDLAIARQDWKRLWDAAMAALGFPAVPRPDELASSPIVDPPKPRKQRRDQTRPEIIEALKTLLPSDDWDGQSDKERCILIERHLKKPAGWCNSRTLRRAIEDYEKTGP